MPSISEKIELSFSAAKLKNKDMLSKSDPMLVVSMSEVNGGQAVEVGRTEPIKDNVNPVWLTKILIDYKFQARQMLVLSIYDWDWKGDPKVDMLNNKKDLIGTVGISVGQLMSAGGKGVIDIGKKQGTLTIQAEPVKVSNEVLILSYSATDLDKKDTFSKSDPFLLFSRINDDNTTTVVYKSSVIKKSLNPVWAPMTIPVTTLCGGDEKKMIKIQCFDADDNGKHDLIGECTTTVSQLRMGASEANTQALINPSKVGKKKYENSGVLKLMAVNTKDELNFTDYIRQGVQIHFTIAVDFTSSNGDPKKSSSLHHVKAGVDNEYMTAIKAVGEVLQDYDNDGFFPALGFGGKLADGRVSHGFYMNGSPNNPNCKGVSGLLQAYYNAVQSITLHNPTNFAPIINHVTRIATKNGDGRSYQVLLFLTNGNISDMEATKKAIIAAADRPMSIIIVGIGKESFSGMKVLDADSKRLSVDDKVASRDIVQFVELRKFLKPGTEVTNEIKAGVGRAVLAELPNQFLEWVRLRQEESA